MKTRAGKTRRAKTYPPDIIFFPCFEKKHRFVEIANQIAQADQAPLVKLAEEEIDRIEGKK